MFRNIEKVIVSCGFGRMESEQEKTCSEVLLRITGQKPVRTFARKSINSFSVRKGMRSGLKVTLRKKRALYFLQKITEFVLPSSTDFKGFPKSTIQGRVFNFGITRLHSFPEIDETSIRGLNVCLVGLNTLGLQELLNDLAIPFKQK